MPSSRLDGWRTRRLGEFCHIVDEVLGARESLPVLSVTKDHGVVPQGRTYQKEIASADRSAYRVIRRGQFALAPMALYYGAIGRLDAVSEGIVSPAYEVFELDGTVDSGFVSALLRSKPMVAKYAALSQGGNLTGKRKITSFETFARIQVRLPTREIQSVVARLLAQSERALASTETLLGRLKASKHALMRQLLTTGHPNFRTKFKPLPGPWAIGRVAPDVSEIPAQWSLVPLVSVAKLESGHTPSRKHPEYWTGDVPWISLQDARGLKRLEITETAETIGELGLANSSARLLPVGTVVFQRTASIGLCSKMGRSMATSQHFANWVCSPQLDPDYLVQVFRHMQREWARLGAGSVLPDVYMPVFKKLKILLPKVAEQTAIAAVGMAFDKRIAAEEAYLDQLRNLRAGLAQELLSGRVEIPDHLVQALATTSKQEATP